MSHSDAAKPIGIVIATDWEARPLLRSLQFQRHQVNIYRSPQGICPTLIGISGMGKEAARAMAYRLCDAGVGELISAGLCGALTPTLKIGDVVTDRIATTTDGVWSKDQRLTLSQRAGAQAVDMETQAIIEAGTRRGVPIRIRRVVSDLMDDDFSGLFGMVGLPTPLRVLARLWNPVRWPLLIRFLRQSQLANQRLVDVLTDELRLRA